MSLSCNKTFTSSSLFITNVEKFGKRPSNDKNFWGTKLIKKETDEYMSIEMNDFCETHGITN